MIVPPAHFRVRYRLTGSPVWVDLPDQDNSPFSIPGVDPGNYELEVSYVSEEGGAGCDAVIYPFEVAEPCPCISIEDVLIQREVAGGPVYLSIFFIPPSTAAGCGYIVQYAQAGLPPLMTVATTVNIATLPIGPIKIPVPDLVPLIVSVFTDCCDGNQSHCYTDTIEPAPEPAAGCVTVTSSNTTVAIVQSRSTGQYHLRVAFPGTPTDPTLCPDMYVIATQIGVISPFGGLGSPHVIPGELANIPLPGPEFFPSIYGMQIVKPLHPSTDVDFHGVRYNIAIHDCCGTVTYFDNVIYGGVQIP